MASITSTRAVAPSIPTLEAPVAGTTPSLRGICPEAPKWILKERWAVLNRYLRSAFEEKFPYSMCRTFSLKLAFALISLYEGRLLPWNCRNEDAVCRINGKEASLTFAHHYLGKLEHCFLVLRMDGEEWIIDPTWKQFAPKTKEGTLEYDLEDPFNKLLAGDECPDILVARRGEFERVFSNFAEYHRSRGEQRAAARTAYCKDYWKEHEGTGEFSALVKSVADPVCKAQLNSKYSPIPDYERDLLKGWESLQKEVDALPSVQACAQRALAPLGVPRREEEKAAGGDPLINAASKV